MVLDIYVCIGKTLVTLFYPLPESTMISKLCQKCMEAPGQPTQIIGAKFLQAAGMTEINYE